MSSQAGRTLNSMPSLTHSRRIRWTAPLVVLAVIGLIAFVPTISAGASTPTLPPLSAQALIAKAQAAKATDLPGLSGTIQLSTNLGIPSLSEFSGAVGGGQGFNPVDLLSGAHSADVWVSKAGFKATYSDSSTTEDDIISNGKDLWTWQSEGTKVTHSVLSGDHAGTAKTPSSGAASPEASSPVKTPDQVAQKLLSSLDPSTAVSVLSPVYVANHRAAYELVLAPKATPSSTVDHVTVAVDAATGLPVRVQIFARGQKAAALDFGFSKLNIGAQNPKLFTFRPPPGATVTTPGAKSATPSTAKPEVRHRGPGPGRHRVAPVGPPLPVGPTKLGKPTVVGQDWATVYVYHSVQLPGQIDRTLSQAATVLPNGGGRLFSTALVNVLLLNNGDVAVGAVNLGALQAAAATAG
jgi:outer membrane lipoprotein-sorting protein